MHAVRRSVTHSTTTTACGCSAVPRCLLLGIIITRSDIVLSGLCTRVADAETGCGAAVLISEDKIMRDYCCFRLVLLLQRSSVLRRDSLPSAPTGEEAPYFVSLTGIKGGPGPVWSWRGYAASAGLVICACRITAEREKSQLHGGMLDLHPRFPRRGDGGMLVVLYKYTGFSTQRSYFLIGPLLYSER